MRLPSPSSWPRGGVAALVAAELFALWQGLILVFAAGDRGAFVSQNLPGVWRGAAPGSLVSALVAAILVLAVAARRPEYFARIERTALVASPLLAVFALPGLLDPNAFHGAPLALMIVTALVALVFERTLAVSLRFFPRFVAAASARGTVWDAAAGASILAYVTYATLASIRLHDKGLTSIFDLALFENLLYCTLAGDHGRTLGDQYFGVHFEPILYAVLPLYALVPRTETLLAVQSLALGGAALPVYLLGRRFMGPTLPAVTIVLAYLAHPALHGPNFYDFHFLALSPFFVAWAAYFFVRRSKRWLALSVFGGLLCREDVALGFALVGAGLFALRIRPKSALAVAAASAAWFVGVKFGFMKHFTVDSFSDYYAPLIRPGDSGFGGVAKTLFTNPLYVASTLFTSQKLLLALQLFVPFAWLPVRQWRTLPLLLPGLAIVGLAASDSSIVMVQFHYSLHFLPYIALGSNVALAVRKPAIRLRAALVVLLGAAVVTTHFGAFFRSTFRTAFHEVSFAWNDEDTARRAAWLRIAAKIPDDAAVCAGEHEGPHVARRKRLYSLKDGVRDARFVVFSRKSLRWGGGEHVTRALKSKRFGIAAIDGPFVLLKRGGTHTGAPAVERLESDELL
ncbi:MAG TPA: DUF2079 domain-containing protein [Polyangiaceae bacterium]